MHIERNGLKTYMDCVAPDLPAQLHSITRSNIAAIITVNNICCKADSVVQDFTR